MKKLFLIIPILIVSALVFSACTQSGEVKEAFNKGYSDARLGFEPRLTASKAAVLPLDDRAIYKELGYSIWE